MTVRVCPKCGMCFLGDEQVCSFDGTPLRTRGASYDPPPPPAHEQGLSVAGCVENVATPSPAPIGSVSVEVETPLPLLRGNSADFDLGVDDGAGQSRL